MFSAPRGSSTHVTRVLQELQPIRRQAEVVTSQLKKLERHLKKVVAAEMPHRRVALSSLAESFKGAGNSMGKMLVIHMLYHRHVNAAAMYLLMPAWQTKNQITADEVRNVVSDANALLRDKRTDSRIEAVFRGALKWRGIGAIGQHAERIRQQLSGAEALLKKDPVQAAARLSDLVKRHPHFIDAVLALAQCLTETDERLADVRLLRRVRTLLSEHELKFSPGLDSLAIRARDDPKNSLWAEASEVIAAGSARLRKTREAVHKLNKDIDRLERKTPESAVFLEFLEKIRTLQDIPNRQSDESYEEKYEKAIGDITQSAFFAEAIQPVLDSTFRDFLDDLQRRSFLVRTLLETTG